MAATTTTIAALRAHLLSLLDASGTLAGVPVTAEEESDPTRNYVYLDSDVEYDGEFHAMKDGRKRRDGMYSFEVVFVAVGAQARATNEASAVSMLAALEDIIAADPGLAGSVDGVLWVALREMEMKSKTGADGFAGVELRARVEVKELLQ